MPATPLAIQHPRMAGPSRRRWLLRRRPVSRSSRQSTQTTAIAHLVTMSDLAANSRKAIFFQQVRYSFGSQTQHRMRYIPGLSGRTAKTVILSQPGEVWQGMRRRARIGGAATKSESAGSNWRAAGLPPPGRRYRRQENRRLSRSTSLRRESRIVPRPMRRGP